MWKFLNGLSHALFFFFVCLLFFFCFFFYSEVCYKQQDNAAVDPVLLAALEQFEYQAIYRLLLVALEEYEDSGTTQKELRRQQPKCYPQFEVNIVCVLATCIFVVNGHNKQI